MLGKAQRLRSLAPDDNGRRQRSAANLNKTMVHEARAMAFLWVAILLVSAVPARSQVDGEGRAELA